MYSYDMLGFGSGIYNGTLHRDVFELVAKLPQQSKRKAFVFSTSGYGKTDPHNKLRAELIRKGFEVIGGFACKGLDTYGAMMLFGGVAKGRPKADRMPKTWKRPESS